ncbi:hypothetical protein [Lactococcus cremoris]|uniref:hypothetical protein n=1 Tax=Lactococcus lactis subsp. cremoris TaxID=1359 RepID=UPI001C254510|nr:hypothetical protein [Lactococcus cremoris]MBU8904917.1 hypothetical protein [Lactococcus cremoris]
MDIKLIIYSREQHNVQIVTGFKLLKQRGDISSLTIIKRYSLLDKMPNEHIIECMLNEKIKIAYDTHDGFYFSNKEERDKYNKYIESVDYYFQRSYNKEENLDLNEPYKIFPLGLNYFVTCPGNPLTKIDFKSKNLHDFLASIQRYSYAKQIYPEKFEERALSSNEHPKILFLTRTWENSPKEINEFRASCIRLLKKKFGKHVIAGFKPTAYAKSNFEDCLVPNILTKRKNYLQLVKESDICITTTGLHRSIGWKFAEYIAASKAIVTEKLNYSPGAELKANTNFLEFDTSEELMNQVMKLVNNKKLLNAMKISNESYYHEFLKPDIMIFNSLKKVLETLKN